MAHAIFTQVDLKGRDVAEAERVLNEQVIPTVKQLPGFQRGVWLRSADGSVGMGIAVFESEQHAKSALEGLPASRPADAPPITSSEVYEVTGLA